jgi:hypothetical protein
MIDALSAIQSSGEEFKVVENRLRSVAINAVREARVALGRDADIWLDADAQTADILFHTLGQLPRAKGDPAYEAMPLVAKEQPTVPKLAELELALAKEISADFVERPAKEFETRKATVKA